MYFDLCKQNIFALYSFPVFPAKEGTTVLCHDINYTGIQKKCEIPSFFVNDIVKKNFR